MAEAALSCIGGLEHCTRLRRLFLYSNRIARIEGLERLTALEVTQGSEYHITAYNL